VVALAALVIALSSCGGGGELLLGYYLYKNVIDKGGNSRIWHGVVTNTNSVPVEGYLVEITANRPDPAADERRTDTTDTAGEYRIIMPYYEIATYEISVKHDGVLVFSDEVGPVFDVDQHRDIQVAPIATVTLSGTATDTASDPLAQVFVTVAKPQAAGTTPDTLLTDGEGKLKYLMTNTTGVYMFENVFGAPLLVAAFHPDLGFGYYFIEEPSSMNSGGTVVMPGTGSVKVSVRVLDGAGNPVASDILPVDSRFAMTLTPAYNLASQLGTAIAAEGLFGNITAEEVIALHPTAAELTVSSTGPDGQGDNTATLAPGLYAITIETATGGAFLGVLVGGESRLLTDTENGEVIEVKIPLD
jgi:protocatechuate 3,4-dioxygenase beta subunit